MSKIFKFIRILIGVSTEWGLILSISLLFLIRESFFQTYLAKVGVGYLSKAFHTTVRIGKVDVVFFDRVYLDEFQIQDTSGRSLASLGTLSIDVRSFSKSHLSVGEVSLVEGQVWICKEKSNGRMNFDFIADYFSGSDTTAKASPFRIAVGKVSLKNTSVRYDDFRIPSLKAQFDPNHINVKHLNLVVQGFSKANKILRFGIERLAFVDGSGFSIRDAKGQFEIRPNGISGKNVLLSLNNSTIRLNKVGYSYQSESDLNDFNNKVQVWVDLDKTRLNTQDFVCFAPELKAMDQELEIQGSVRNTINKLTLTSVTVRYKRNTRLEASLTLPSLDSFSVAGLLPKISYAYLDFNEINRMPLPGNQTLTLPKEVMALGHVCFSQLGFTMSDYGIVVQPVTLATGIGSVALKSPIKVTYGLPLTVEALQPGAPLLSIQKLNLSGIIPSGALNYFDGDLAFNKVVWDGNNVSVNNGRGTINHIKGMGEAFENLRFDRLNLVGDELDIRASSNDPRIGISLEGHANIRGIPKAELTLDIHHARLRELNLTDEPIQVSGKVALNVDGTSLNSFSADAAFDQVRLVNQGLDFTLSEANMDFVKHPERDRLDFTSNLVNITYEGRIDPQSLQAEIKYAFSKVIPALVKAKEPPKRSVSNEISLVLDIKDANELTRLFVPDLNVAPNSSLELYYSGKEDTLTMRIKSPRLEYQGLVVEELNLMQRINENGILAIYLADRVQVTDSLVFDKLIFTTTGEEGILNSKLRWNRAKDKSALAWSTKMLSETDYEISILERCEFELNGMGLRIKEKGNIRWIDGKAVIENLAIHRLNQPSQGVRFDGVLSASALDTLHVTFDRLPMADVSQLADLDQNMKGELVGTVHLIQVLSSPKFASDVWLNNFYLDNEEIGDIQVIANYIDSTSIIDLSGQLKYHAKPTLRYAGLYELNKRSNNLKMNLEFDKTDIAFVNAFMDSTVLKDIEGNLDGNLVVKGSLNRPKITGKLKLNETSAMFPLLGCTYSINGAIDVDEGSFKINKMPITDQEGNVGCINGTVNHFNFTKFNYDVNLDFEDDFFHKGIGFKPKKIDRFMLLNTAYVEGDVYYGKAYGRGTANVSGYGSKMDITVEVETRKGTRMVFPMYDNSEIEEDQVIRYISDIEEVVQKEIPKDLSGVDLNIKFKVTPDADLFVVFNEQTQDEIQAKVKGDLDLSIDPYYHFRLDGTLNMLPGSIYNFSMGPAKKPFYINTGTIFWSGDVENAAMDIQASAVIKNANMLELSPEQFDKSLQNQEAHCVMNLGGSLIAPTVAFKVEAPKAPETGKALINRVNEDEDELKRQFFSLLIFGKFQPLVGTNSANETAALDLVEGQINAALSQMSKNYNIKMDLGSSNVSTSLQKAFFDDRLIVSTTFGVQSPTGAANATAGGLIGDISLEYLVNEKGTFRVNAFNRSNTNTVKENAGAFTQGAGLSYREEFNDWRDFILFQSFLDVFRSSNRKVLGEDRKDSRVPLPIEKGVLNETKEPNRKKR
jgi:hypothetical protein